MGQAWAVLSAGLTSGTTGANGTSAICSRGRTGRPGISPAVKAKTVAKAMARDKEAAPAPEGQILRSNKTSRSKSRIRRPTRLEAAQSPGGKSSAQSTATAPNSAPRRRNSASQLSPSGKPAGFSACTRRGISPWGPPKTGNSSKMDSAKWLSSGKDISGGHSPRIGSTRSKGLASIGPTKPSGEADDWASSHPIKRIHCINKGLARHKSGSKPRPTHQIGTIFKISL